MNFPARLVAVLAVVLFVTSTAAADLLPPCIFSPSDPQRAEKLKQLEDVEVGSAVGQDLNEYAMLFHDLRKGTCDPDGKIRDTFEAKLRSQRPGFKGFLSGGITSLAYSTGMVLGAQGRLTASIDELLGNMPWDPEVGGGCGFAGMNGDVPRWRAGNTCTEEYAVAAQGHAWRGAYFMKTRRTARAESDRRQAVRRVNDMLLDFDNSICIHDPAEPVDGPKGPCNSNIDALERSIATGGDVGVVPINHQQENAAYGVGIVTTLAHVYVGLEAMGDAMRPDDYRSFEDAQTVMAALAMHGQRSVEDREGMVWANVCFDRDPADAALISVATRDRHCSDDNIPYLLAMYPVAAFYRAAGFGLGRVDPEKYAYEGTFPNASFDEDKNGVVDLTGQFAIARYEVYKTFAHDWWANRASRPAFDFDFEPRVCASPDPILVAPLSVYSKQKNIRVETVPQPEGTTITWKYYNAEGGDRQVDGPTFIEFDAPCEATGHNLPGVIRVQLELTTEVEGCGTRKAEGAVHIAVNKPSAFMAGDQAIVRGETAYIPVELQGPGPWALTWEDGSATTVTASSAERPHVYLRPVTPETTTTYHVTGVKIDDCEGTAGGSATVHVYAAAGVLTVHPVTASPGVPAVFSATLTRSTGGPIPGAEVEFTVLGEVVGKGVTDANGRATLTHVVDVAPGSYRGTIKASFAGTDDVRGTTAAGDLFVRCEGVSVTPSALNVTRTGGRFEILVGASEHCGWLPSTNASWIHVDVTSVRTGPGVFHITVDEWNGAPRTGVVTFGGNSVSVHQAGGCTYRFVPEVAYIPARGGLTSFDIAAPADCVWKVESATGWISIESRTLEPGAGEVTINAQRNSEPNAKRSGRIVLRDAASNEIVDTADVNQEAPPPESKPELEQNIKSGSVENGENVSMRLVISGGPVTYEWYADTERIRSGQDDSLANLTLGPGDRGYPASGRAVTYEVIAWNTKGRVTGTATWVNHGNNGPCRVPILSDSLFRGNQWPSDQNSPFPGARQTLRVVAQHGVGSKGEDLVYQWYHGVSGDRRSKVSNGTGDEVSVSPFSTAHYWVEVTDPSCGSNQSRTAEIQISEVPFRRRRAAGHDFTGDRLSDIPWHNRLTGATEIWAMNGTTRTQTVPVGTSSAQLQSTGDLNGDDRPDLVWRDPATGRNEVWIMSGTFPVQVKPLESRSGGNWSIGAVADFDDDRHHDIVWHNSATGENEIWFQDGTSHEGTWALPRTPSGSWGIHGTGDFNGDQKPDLFLHDRATGTSSVWLMNDAARASVASNSASGVSPKRSLRVQAQTLPGRADANNVPMLVADMNNDGRPDVVWRNVVTGENSVWIMQGTARTETVAIESRPEQEWQIGGGGPVNGGGSSDERAVTALTVSATPAAYNTATAITATLAANGSAVANHTLVFRLNGNEVARLVTDANGTAVAAASVAGLPAGVHPNAISVRFDGTEQYRASEGATALEIERPLPVVTWSTPAAIDYGTPLSSVQLNATADAAGSFAYSPAAGAVLDAGFNRLEVTFTPADSGLAPVKKSVVLTVNPAAITISWPAPSPVAYGTPLSSAQLRATTTVAGTFTYNPPAGTILGVGTHALQATFVPATAGNYTSATASVTLTVVQGSQSISWPTPAAIVYGRPLSAAQLNASVAVSGSAPAGALTYSPAAGTVLDAGTHTLTVTAAATPFYAAASKSVQLTVSRATPVVTWSAPAAIVYGTALTQAQLNATANVRGTFTYSPAAGTVLNAGAHTLAVQFTPEDANHNGASASVSLTVLKAKPSLTWSAPAAIVYGTPLGAAQLNASSNVAGVFAYSPAEGTILDAGTHALALQFTPADPANYESASATNSLTVAKARQTLTWSAPAAIVYGTPLGGTQLNAQVSVVGPSSAGALTYDPPAGAVLQAGLAQTLTVSAAATSNYEPASMSVSIDVLKAKPVLTWAQPAPIVYRTVLSAAQLNATANVAGTFVYTPAAGAVLEAGIQPLAVHFTPADTRNYEEAGATVTLEVEQATPLLTWPEPSRIVYGLALDATQLNATADVAGTFTYDPAAGSILDAGTHTLTVQFTPADARNFRNGSAAVTLAIDKAKQTLTWATPGSIVYGTPLSAAQLNASVSVVGPAAAGALVYTPAAGTVLDAGNPTLTVTALETNNYERATASVTLTVARAPLAVTVHAKSKLYGASVPPLTGTVSGVVNDDPVAASYTTTATLHSHTGTYPIAATLVDPASRLGNYEVTVTPSTLTVLPAPLRIAANPAESQYSDPLPQLGATFTGFVLGETPAVLSGTLSIATTATALSAPGLYPIAIGGLASSDYAIVYVPSTFTVRPEDARVVITSPLFVASSASPTSVTLAATINDISATGDAAGDVDAGDIRHATLTFVDRATDAVLCTAPIGLVSGGDARIGVATCRFSRAFPSGTTTLNVGARVGGYYVRDRADEDAALTVAPPTADFVTGSGAIAFAAAKVNVNLKHDRGGVAKGNFTVTYERTVDGAVRRYEISATTIDSLAIRRAARGGTATLVGTAVLRDVTTTTPVVIAEGAPLIATLSDNGEPAAGDTLAVSLFRKDGGFWFSAAWDGARTAPQPLLSGNLQVHHAK